MLPFLKNNKNQTGLVTEIRKPDKEDSNDSEGLHAAMQDFMTAMEAKDIKAMAAAFKSAFLISDAAPHEEYDEESKE